MRATAVSVIRKVAIRHQIKPSLLMGISRKGPIVRARQEAMYEIFIACPHLSLLRIGAAFKRDHTTVLHGIHRHCASAGTTYRLAKMARDMPILSPARFEAFGEAMRRAA